MRTLKAIQDERRRQRIARGYRSEGEEQSLRIRAEADRRSTELLAEARGQAEAIRGEGEAEATRTYAAAIRRNPDFYKFLRTLESYEKIINEKIEARCLHAHPDPPRENVMCEWEFVLADRS